MAGRATEEWRGSTPDSTIPPRVRLRVWERAGGCCQICERKLMPGDRWDADHVVALVNGGEHAEGNLQVACVACHRGKTAADVAEKSRARRIQAKHAGIRKPSTFACARTSRFKKRMDGTVVDRETGEPVRR